MASPLICCDSVNLIMHGAITAILVNAASRVAEHHSLLARRLHVLSALFRLSVKVGPSSRAQALFHILLYLLPPSENPRPSQQSLNTGRTRRSDTVDYCQSHRTKPVPPPLFAAASVKCADGPYRRQKWKKLKYDKRGEKDGGKFLDI